MKNILGLDLGTNSIGWAVVEGEETERGLNLENIGMAGSRIIPMDAAVLGDFAKGTTKSQTSERTSFRGVRRLRERHLLRRERLHRVLQLLGYLPEHYAKCIDFENHPGKFLTDTECKLPWRQTTDGQYEFIFQSSFEEMLVDFAKHQPQLVADGRKVPSDWTIYYLRKKALTEKISNEELAWLILNFNQKRGYYQLRGEDEAEEKNKLVEFYALKVVSVEATDQRKGNDVWYNVHLENGWIYRRSSKMPLDWVGKTKEFIVTTDLDEDGMPKKDKDGNVKRSFKAPTADDWMLVKKKTEADINQSHETVGEYIYDYILQDPSVKVRGRLVRTIERKYYKDELIAILDKQKAFHPELQSKEWLEKCARLLYPQNEAHYMSLINKDFTYFLVNDIIFYQRPLKSKKSLIGDCPLEKYVYIDASTKEVQQRSIKCIVRSNPFFQEFRLWQFINNLRIYEREKEVNGKLTIDVDVTGAFLQNHEDYANLFDWLNERKEIKQDTLLQSYFKIKKIKGQDVLPFRWNYVEDKSYPCNDTRASILGFMEKASVPMELLTKEKEYELWHILYSVEDKYEIVKALTSFNEKNNFGESFVETFKKFPSFPKEYGSYSEKAIKNLLTLMRQGHHWSIDAIDKEKVMPRIDKLMTGECDDSISQRAREQVAARGLNDISQYQGLPLWLASYVIYNRHSESSNITKWETPQDMTKFINDFRQYSLRNPIVEQIVLETLRTVKDIWEKKGHLDEIHVELGRDMKNPADKRLQLTMQTLENENTNLRIKRLLAELVNPEYEVENVHPFSPSQQDILRIYEEYALNNEELPDDITDILKKLSESDPKKQPSKNEFMRYKLWLEQKYCSPYTGAIIPLGKLFTPSYEIEHIIPQSRYFDDSFSNKVICEAEVNKLKGNQLAYEFIKTHHGEIVPLGFGQKVTVLSVAEYEEFIKRNYSTRNSKPKMKKLLLDDIPEAFIQRQLNDSRYISREIKGLLSNVVREEGEQEEISKNLIATSGAITDRLKSDWGIKDVWNDLILPRFERMNRLTGSNQFTALNENNHLMPVMPLEFQKGFNKKRIDHRHHAMDAIVIACATRNIVNYLNNESASKNAKISRFDLQRILCNKVHTDNNGNYRWQLKKPWETFTQDVHEVLENIIVSFKQNLRIINKATNYYQHYDENGRKIVSSQTKGDSWAVRKPLHKETVFGNVNLRKIKPVKLSEAITMPHRIVDKELKEKVLYLLSMKYDMKKIDRYFKDNANDWKKHELSKVPVYYFSNETNVQFVASRKSLDTSFNAKKITESVTDTGIQKILINHLSNYNGKADEAFSPDGIDEMNRNIKALNDGKAHQPILKVRVYEPQGNKFVVGVTGNKKSKYVEAAKGTNLFFAVYQGEDGKRSYDSVPLNIAIELQKQGLPPVPEKNENGDNLLFWLSPNDLVYVPTDDEIANGKLSENMDKSRIYKMVSCTESEGHFIPVSVANPILQTIELGSNNKAQRAWTNEMIKDVCIPVEINRLGEIRLKSHL
jgi:CRISPR-associated endonuclease Csn1